MSSSQRWNEIDHVLAAALELEPSEQAAFLDEACAGDHELRQEVQSLLAHDLAESLVRGETVAEATRLFSKALVAELKDKVIGPYQIIRELGTGGMGCVYLAHDQRLNRPVAVKLLSNYNMAAAERLRRFRQEALAASALNHPNILTIYEIGEAEGKNFIVTEFVDGSTLSKRISAGPIAVSESLDLGIQIAGALSAAHAAGIIHRDIKPANVMVRGDGLAKVLDFGLAKYEQAHNDTASVDSIVETAPGAVMGTAAYMSPEQARGASLDARTDLWSLGAILYEMVSGSRPFQGDTPIDVMAAVIERQPLPFSTSLAVPDSMAAIVFKALQKDREARYQTANELLTELKELAKRLEFASHGRSVSNETRHEAVREQAKSSIAVLPFVNMSADAENEYFCDGLSEELLNALTRIEDLKVAARTSTFSFKGKDVTVSGIGRALNVSSVLEGSVRKSGNRLRITVQLINAADGYHLWSERYDREMKDIFDVQDEIALAVVDALKVKLLGKEKAAVLKRYTENVEAYQLYLKGRYYWWKTVPEEFAKGRNYFEQAVVVDPSYGLSYCGLSSYFGFGSAWGMVPPELGWPKAVAANAKALKLDDTLAEVHNNMGGLNMVYHRDPLAAEQSITRAIELNPKFQEAHYLYSFFLLTRSRFDEAITQGKVALDLDPFSMRINNHVGFAYYLARRYDEAIAQYKQAIELDANNAAVHEALGDAFEQKRMFDEAIEAWQNALALKGDREGAVLLGSTYSESGFEPAKRAAAQWKHQGLKDRFARGEYLSAIHLARTYVQLADYDESFAWLEKASRERTVFPLLMSADPFYDNLRADPRFEKVLIAAT